MNNKSSIKNTVLKAVGLACGVGTLVLNILKIAPVQTSLTLLSISVIAYGILLLEDK